MFRNTDLSRDIPDRRPTYRQAYVIWTAFWAHSCLRCDYSITLPVCVHVYVLCVFTARCYASTVFAVMQCLSVCLYVCPSVTFVDHVKTNKHIFEIFSPSGSDTILVLPYQRGCPYCDGNPPTWASNARGYDKMTMFFTNISLYLRNGYS